MSDNTIPFIDEHGLWCSCGATMNPDRPPPTCHRCDRATHPLLAEARRNRHVVAFLDSKSITYGMPRAIESKAAWWSRMVDAAREAGVAAVDRYHAGRAGDHGGRRRGLMALIGMIRSFFSALLGGPAAWLRFVLYRGSPPDSWRDER
jgi:hypothetical protein